jgi:crotonobetainyl-CoA:carnitine CoA-transferase CaiB-like acyl-CoA transferase
MTPVGATIADHMSSQHLATGILAALFARHSTGRGQRVDVSLVGGAIWAQASEFSAYLASGKIPGRSNGGHPLINGTYGIVPTADGYVAVVGVVAAARPAFAKLIGNEGFFDDPRFVSPLMTEAQKIALLKELEPIFVTKITDDWVSELRAIGVRCAPVRDYAAIVADPEMYENGYLVKMHDAERGEFTVVGSPLRMSDTPVVPSARAPELGEHTEEILLEIGLDWEEIAALRHLGAI